MKECEFQGVSGIVLNSGTRTDPGYEVGREGPGLPAVGSVEARALAHHNCLSFLSIYQFVKVTLSRTRTIIKKII